MISLLIGIFGSDWFYLAAGNGTYILIGFIKLLTGIIGFILPCWFNLSSCLRSDGSKIVIFIMVVVVLFLTTAVNMAWWLADWIRILLNTFYDGNGVDLKNW